jgi:hypothetical protein
MDQLTAGQSYVVEVRHCVEIIPNLASDWAQLVVDSPKRDDVALDYMRDYDRNTVSGSFVRSITEMAQNALPGINRLLGSAAAAMASMPIDSFLRPPNQLMLNPH